MDTENKTIEQVARALCWKNGMDPDTTLGGDGVNFLWHEYIEPAKAAIEVTLTEMGKWEFENAPFYSSKEFAKKMGLESDD